MTERMPAKEAATMYAGRAKWFVRGKGKLIRHKSGEMNGLERAYAQRLDLQKAAGVIVEYWFEQMTFKLAADCRYTPDFVVMLPTGELQAHECKGFMTDDAGVKLKVFASKFPFDVFVCKKAAKKHGLGEWEITQVKV